MATLLELTGKTILVLGASSGIGQEAALELDRLGACVILLARNEQRLQETLARMQHPQARYYSFDLSDLDGIAAITRKIIAECGKIDGLLYCAGVGTPCPLKMLKPDKLLKMMTINTLAFVEVVRSFSTKTSSNDGASFVGISSIKAHVGDKGDVAYCASKAAMNGAVRAMAHELAARGIRVNTISPAWVDTNLLQHATMLDSDPTKTADPRQYLGILAPNNVAKVAAFLLSDASAYVTGSDYAIDAGYLT